MTQNRTMLILAVVLLLTGLAFGAEQPKAQPGGATTVAPAAPAPEIGTFHNPTDWLEMGADVRFREHYGFNWTGLNNDEKFKGYFNNRWHFERYRTRWWTKIKINDDTSINTRFTWEFRTWEDPKSKSQSTDFDEIIMDNFNLSMKNFLDMPITAVLGRQDLFLGQGWLVADGTPQDGSRTFYFDALRFTWDLAEKTKLETIYIHNMPNSDWWLKPINDRDKYVTQEQENGVILYLTDKSTPTQLEGYFMYKNNNPVNPVVGKAYSLSPAAVRKFSKKAEIYTFGGAASAPINDNWNYRLEGAVQTGESASPNSAITANNHTEDLLAFGAKGDLQYSFKDDLDNRLHTTYEYLSGDDPDSKRVESFNPLWGQWPQWSELYQPYVTTQEDWLVSNLHRLAFGHKFKPNQQWEILTDWHLLWADEDTYNIANNSKFRGHLLTCWARYNFTKQLKGNLVFEYLWPGHYYAQTNRDNAWYFHWTVEYTF